VARELMWASLESPGWEHVRIDDGHPEWNVFDSMLVRVDGGQIRRGGYTLILDKAWRTLELRLMVEQSPGNMTALHFLASGDGMWTDADGRHLPEFDGCIDVDIQWTPLTNTLPIRRMRLTPGQEESISVVYIPLPSLEIGVAQQRYVGLDKGHARFESVASGFTRDIAIDEEGFVVDYPNLFRRDWPR
jgi:uncharacterized protein